ncbi:MAG: xanthine dehydrogenase accessory protein XdhC [Hyphomicrobiaceae bacterium]|nr:xanthine dehydrogenase accessory protein XdhC [Hyphomicrobiaceae bacterium]MCC0023343.1 xanthine dehydrogenase accessory protein XdhC [Hyphomicrobiaceae bacterium]
MSLFVAQVRRFAGQHASAVCVRLDQVRGSSPRDEGALMLVSDNATIGTIGGGHMEHMAIDVARRMLRDGDAASVRDVALGPETGQCCGGRVIVKFERITNELVAQIGDQLERMRSGDPHVFVFGAGHVGRALVRALHPLPLQVHLVDERQSELALTDVPVDLIHAALPEQVVRTAPAGSGFVVLTHDHALDFLIAREVLARGDAYYAGMIGSKTKRAVFASWLAENGDDPRLLDALLCPIGNKAVDDKRPEVIAALAAAEILVHSQVTRMGMPGRFGAVDDKLGVV